VWTVRAAEPTTRNISLKADQVSRGDDGRIVVTATATGDLRGALTLTITGTGPNGTITTGEWVLVNTYIEDLYGPGHSASDGHEHHDGTGEDHEVAGHAAGERLVLNGTLSGPLTGGTLTFDADGRLSSLSFVQLSISLGSLTFQGVSGSGTLALAGLQDGATSSGSAAISF
jgi:hypothetical protein